MPRAGGGRLDAESETLIPTIGGVFDVAPTITAQFGEQTGQDAMNAGLVSFQTRGSNIDLHQGVAATCGLNIHSASGGAPCIAFDPTQITSRENRSNPQPGDPCHTLTKGSHAP